MNSSVPTIGSAEPYGDCAPGDCRDFRASENGTTPGGPPTGVRCHETACVDQPSTIGPGTSIGPLVHIMPGASIGANCQIGRNVVVASTAVISDDVVIGHNVVVEDGVRLDAGVFCGPGVVFATLTKPQGNRMDEQLPSPGTDRRLVERGAGGQRDSASRTKPISVYQGATLGANATILGGVTVHDFSMVGAGAVVTHDVPRHAVMTGVPARRTGWLCRCTEKILGSLGNLKATCPACHRHYQISKLGLKQYSPEEESKRRKAELYRSERQYIESITPNNR